MESAVPLRPAAYAASRDERLPESFFEVLGSWEDERGPERILRDIRRAPRDRRVRVR